MEWLLPTATFLAGALTTAMIARAVDRFFAAPRVDCALADLSISRSRVRAHRSIPVTDNLRKLLAEGSTEYIEWDDRFTSEHALDFSVLELIEREEQLHRDISECERLLALLAASSTSEFVLALGRDQNLLSRLVNALVWFPEDVAYVEQGDKAKIFPLVEKRQEKDGKELLFVHLDLPGNPFPIVGSPWGRPEINAKAAPLGIAMSTCDQPLLSKILEIGRSYCSQRSQDSTALRSELQAVRRQASYLQVDAIFANRGDTPAYLSTSICISVDKGTPVTLSLVDYDAEAERQAPSTVIRDTAGRIADWAPTTVQLVEDYRSAIRYLAVENAQSRRLSFVSDGEVGVEVRNAVDAIRTGHAQCTLALSQYTPRRRGWFAWANRFEKRVRFVQTLRGS